MSAEPTPQDPTDTPEAPEPPSPPTPAVGEESGLFEPLGALDIADGMDMREVVTRQRLHFCVPVRQPLVLISQIQRSGGTLISQLLDGHSALHVHPGELHIGRPNKYRWPDLDLEADAADLFDSLREQTAIRDAREGYLKHGGAKPDEGAPRLPFIFSGQLQARLFTRALPAAPRSRRQVLDAYATAYFNAWLDYGGLYRRSETVRYWVGFVARLLSQAGQVEAVFEDYPDGRMIIPLRDPESWLASAQRHSGEYADTSEALDLWQAAHARALQLVGARSETVRLVRFEHLVGDTEATMRGVARFLGVDFEPSMLEPTFNGMAAASNSSFAAGVGVDPASLDRTQHLDDGTRGAIRARTAALYRKLGAIADYQGQRAG